jgi:3-methylcrotonyl-CoA carboxylase alpha subunit
MLKKVLIANRGEIAGRIARTARRLGIATVAVASEADAASPHVTACDEHVVIGPAAAAESYLDARRIIAAAGETGADCLHPGYGFLAENPDFAQACADAGLVFIGPSPAAMRQLGDKAKARALARRLGIPTVPGDDGPRQDATALAGAARRIGFPLMIKAAAGGGGRGMRPVLRAADFAEALASAQREAGAAFGDDRVLLERLVAPARHVEVQVFGDQFGHVVHLFERECSLQRRHQKIIEEAPAPGIAEALRKDLTAAAVRLAAAVGYAGAGTVEFLVEGGGLAADAPWYFIEANTRLQVEHPVTEAITGLDLVEWQFRIAAGEPLPLAQDAIRHRAVHAIEARLTAEDPARGFLPSTGEILAWRMPAAEGLRVDAGATEGSVVTGHYDPLLAKIIATAATRAQALDRLAAALSATVILGPVTNAAFLRALARDEDVRAGRLDTDLLARKLAALAPEGQAPTPRALAAGVAALVRAARDPGPVASAASPWDADDAFQLGGTRRVALDVMADGRALTLEAAWPGGRLEVGSAGEGADPHPARRIAAAVAEGRAYVLDDLRQTVLAWPQWEQGGAAAGEQGGAVRSPISGRVAKIQVSEGARVARGDPIAVVEAMKMEHIVHAGCDGVIARVRVEAGEQVAQGTLLAELAEEKQDEAAP